MHESRLVTDLVHEASRVAEANGLGSVQRLTIEIGALSHVTPASLESHLVEAASSSPISGASFDITKSADTTAENALDVRLVSMTVEEA